MRKLVAIMNITLDGFCDHTAGVPDAEMHQHYADLIRNAGDILYGRITYQLMESYWPEVVRNPVDSQASNDFAVALQDINKIVFSRTLKSIGWKNTRLVNGDLQEEVMSLKQSGGSKDILVGSPSLIAACTKLNLFDEYQLCIHPVIIGKGLPLFRNISERSVLKLLRTKIFKASGAVVHTYAPK